MRIVTKTFRDMVPKTVMHLLINNTKDFIYGELLANLYAAGDQTTMMEESPEEERRRNELLRMYHASKEALKIIGDVSMATTYQPAPPPLKTDWNPNRAPSPTPPTPRPTGGGGGGPPPNPAGNPGPGGGGGRGPPAPPGGRPLPQRGAPPAPGGRGMPPPMVPS